MADIGAGVGGTAQAAASIVAANIQADAANKATEATQQRYAQTRGDLLPYNQAGQAVLPSLTSLATSGQFGGGKDFISPAADYVMKAREYSDQAAGIGVGPQGQANLENTPGYQFQLAQGLKATQASAAARGLGVSGAAMKGAAQWATGLASSNYQQQFANAMALSQNAMTQSGNVLALNTAQQGNLTNQYNRLAGVGTLGENAAAQTGTTGANLANTAAATTQAAGQASAAGVLGVGSSINQGIQNSLAYKAFQNAINPAPTGGYFGSPQQGYLDYSQTIPA